MKSKNPRGPGYGAAGAAAAVAVCLGAMVLAPAVTHPAPAVVPVALARALVPAGGGEHGPAAGDCTLIVPANPLTAAGLATPYQLSGGCTMADAASVGAFVQATIAEPGGQLAVYDPLVVTQGTAPAAAPPVPVIPAGSTVGIWTGFNGNSLRLTGPGAPGFVQGIPGSLFGQVAADNASAFFAAAAGAVIPPLGVAKDGKPCPSTRDFSLVDQDPSDNVTAHYILTTSGQTAERFSGVAGTVIGNGSDNNLLANFVDPALGCVPFTVPDLSNPGHSSSSQGLNELQAAGQGDPVALVPPNDPMTEAGGALSAVKTNAYRGNVGQPALTGDPAAYAKFYCAQIQAVAPARLALDAPFETGPSPAAGQSLAQFLQARYAASLVLLGC